MTEINKIAVLGAGLMGHGIAQAFAQKGLAVALYDLGDELLARAMEHMAGNLETFVEMGLETAASAKQAQERITPHTDLAQAVRDADLVVEAVPEDMRLKRDLFAQMQRHAPAHAIFASNTSMLSISDFGSEVQDQGRLIITHWFNPPHIVPVVEVVLAQGTSDQTRENIFELLTRIGKTPVLVQKEIPGFLVNRIQTAMFREVISLLEQGVASAKDIDRAIMGSFGLRLSVQGVLKTMDLAGLDLMLKGCGYLFKHIDSGTEPPALLQEKVDRKELGAGNGQGFFSYPASPDGKQGDSPAKARDRQLLTVLKALSTAKD